jgi:hypothetical protein
MAKIIPIPFFLQNPPRTARPAGPDGLKPPFPFAAPRMVSVPKPAENRLRGFTESL